MRSTKAFLIGAGTAYFLTRLARGRAQRGAQEALKDVELSIDESGVATLRGSVESSKQADELVAQVASLPGVHDVAALLRVSERRAA
jgi:osmotically-inducible protein OsmY